MAQGFSRQSCGLSVGMIYGLMATAQLDLDSVAVSLFKEFTCNIIYI